MKREMKTKQSGKMDGGEMRDRSMTCAEAGRIGGLIGGRMRMDSMTEREKHELAMQGVRARRGEVKKK